MHKIIIITIKLNIKKISAIILVIIFIGLSSNIVAQTQLEMNQNAQKSYKKSDNELNKIYLSLIKILDKVEVQKLIKVQKCWIKFRNSHCEFESSQYEGGSIKPLIYSTCLEELTKKRIGELKQSIKNRDL